MPKEKIYNITHCVSCGHCVVDVDGGRDGASQTVGGEFPAFQNSPSVMLERDGSQEWD